MSVAGRRAPISEKEHSGGRAVGRSFSAWASAASTSGPSVSCRVMRPLTATLACDLAALEMETTDLLRFECDTMLAPQRGHSHGEVVPGRRGLGRVTTGRQPVEDLERPFLARARLC